MATLTPRVRAAVCASLLACVLGFGNACFAAEPEIVGTARFTQQIKQALALLKTRDKAAYAIVEANVGRIQQGERSGMWAYKTPPTYEVSDKTAFASLTWCAATIAHDSYHSKLYHDYLKAHKKQGATVPNAVWTGTGAEKKCMAHQIAVMKAIGAPQSEISYAQTQAGGQYVKDGANWADYKKRSW